MLTNSMPATPPVGARSRAKHSRHHARCLLILTGVALFTTTAHATPPTGKLQGLVANGNGDANLTATLTGTDNDRTLLLDLREPFACNLKASFHKEEDKTLTFKIIPTSTSGGMCNDVKGDVTITEVDPVKDKPAWKITFTRKNAWTGTLTQSTTSP